jgi:hypothetical protein
MQDFEFDKFMQDIVQREEASREKIKHYADHHADSPARRYNERYRERTHNRIRYNDSEDGR